MVFSPCPGNCYKSMLSYDLIFLCVCTKYRLLTLFGTSSERSSSRFPKDISAREAGHSAKAAFRFAYKMASSRRRLAHPETLLHCPTLPSSSPFVPPPRHSLDLCNHQVMIERTYRRTDASPHVGRPIYPPNPELTASRW